MIITSLNNPTIKEISKLKNKKYRDLTNTYLVEGDHLVEEAYKNNLLTKIILLEDTICNYDIEKIYVTKEVMKKLTELDTPNKIIGIVKKNTPLPIGNKILILDNIQDPGNLGTIIRSSVAFDIDTIVLSPNTVDIYNPKVVRSTMGAIFRINIIESDDLVKTIKEMKKHKIKILSTSLQTDKTMYNVSYDKTAIVIGNEANGVEKEIIDLTDEKIKIPMPGKTESLNASVATAVILYEAMRNQLNK